MDIDVNKQRSRQEADSDAPVTPDRAAIELGFLILALQPDQRFSVGVGEGEYASGFSKSRMRILRETDYEASAESAPSVIERLQAYEDFEPPGLDAEEDGRLWAYPFAEHYEVNRSDLGRLAEFVWDGMDRFSRG